MMFGQMTAGSWIYIGSQGIVQGTYETFAEAGRQHCGGVLSDKWILTAGLGGMGGAQPLAATMAGASMLAVECQQSRIDMRLATRYLDRQAGDLDDALAILRDACARRQPVSVGLLGNAAEILPELVRRGVRPDMVTDQTSAHDLVYGYLPAGWTVERWRAAQADPAQHAGLVAAAKKSIVAHVRAMLAFHRAGHSDVRLRQQHPAGREGRGRCRRVRIPGIRPRVHPAALLRGEGSVPLGRALGRSRGHLQDRSEGEGALSSQRAPAPLARHGARTHRVPGLARADLLAGTRRAASRRSRVQRDGEAPVSSKAPIVIGRDHLDTGSVASPNRETEAMADGSDAVSDWPLLNLLLNTAAGATWVSFHHGGGVGMGYSQHAGVVIVCDGTDAAAKRIERVLWNDPASGVMRHADAGYAKAIEVAKAKGLKLPMLGR